MKGSGLRSISLKRLRLLSEKAFNCGINLIQNFTAIALSM